MSFPFNPTSGPIRVWGELEGPGGLTPLRLLLDTGADHTFLALPSLLAVGYGPASAQPRAQVMLVSGSMSVPICPALSVRALGQKRIQLPVGGHVFPPCANADGLLGLDFFRGFELTIDFRGGQITLV